MKAVPLKTSAPIGNRDTYRACQAHARRLRARGARRRVAPSAALPGGASGREVDDGRERAAGPRDGRVIVIFGRPARLVGWKAVERGAPPADVLRWVRHFSRSR